MNKTRGKMQACSGSFLSFPLVLYKYSPAVRASSVRFPHLSCWTVGGGRAQNLCPWPAKNYTVLLLIPWLETGSPELFTPDKVWFLSAHFVASERYCLRRSPQPFPLLPVFYSPLSTAYCAVSIVILPDGTMSYATTVCHATQMLRKTYSALHSPRPKLFSAHKYFALWQNSKFINEVSDTELWSCCFLNKLWLC